MAVEPLDPTLRIGGLELELQETKAYNERLKGLNDELEDRIKELEARNDLMLSPEDPFEKILIEMVELQRRKAQDYAADGDTLKNMRFVVDMLDIPDYTVVEDCNAMVLRKCARIVNLRGRSANNESVRDSYLDRAVYAVLAIVALDDDR